MTYEIVKVLGVQNDAKVKREQHLVKTAEQIVCRGTGTFDLYKTDHVIVEALSIVDEDTGKRYEETHVVASDPEGKAHPAVLYLATRALTVPEAMFGLGEVNPPTPTIDNEAEAE